MVSEKLEKCLQKVDNNVHNNNNVAHILADPDPPRDTLIRDMPQTKGPKTVLKSPLTV